MVRIISYGQVRLCVAEFHETVSSSTRNGTVDTENTLKFIPQPADHGTTIACRNRTNPLTRLLIKGQYHDGRFDLAKYTYCSDFVFVVGHTGESVYIN
jgi:hypothetical protein